MRRADEKEMEDAMRRGDSVGVRAGTAMLERHSRTPAAPTAGPRSLPTPLRALPRVSPGVVALAPMISTPLIFIRLAARRDKPGNTDCGDRIGGQLSSWHIPYRSQPRALPLIPNVTTRFQKSYSRTYRHDMSATDLRFLIVLHCSLSIGFRRIRFLLYGV